METFLTILICIDMILLSIAVVFTVELVKKSANIKTVIPKILEFNWPRLWFGFTLGAAILYLIVSLIVNP